MKQVIWFGYLNRMEDERLPKITLKSVPTSRKKNVREVARIWGESFTRERNFSEDLRWGAQQKESLEIGQLWQTL